MHVTNLERNQTLPLFLPLMREGDSSKFTGEAPRSLTLTRRDESLSHFDLLDATHANGNAVFEDRSNVEKILYALLVKLDGNAKMGEVMALSKSAANSLPVCK